MTGPLVRRPPDRPDAIPGNATGDCREALPNDGSAGRGLRKEHEERVESPCDLGDRSSASIAIGGHPDRADVAFVP